MTDEMFGVSENSAIVSHPSGLAGAVSCDVHDLCCHEGEDSNNEGEIVSSGLHSYCEEFIVVNETIVHMYILLHFSFSDNTICCIHVFGGAKSL